MCDITVNKCINVIVVLVLHSRSDFHVCVFLCLYACVSVSVDRLFSWCHIQGMKMF